MPPLKTKGTMKYSQRRQMIGNLAAFLAVPLTFGRVKLGEPSGGDDSKADRKRNLAANDGSSVRPRIAAPKGSVMRRG
jgi:hypothetical protein